MKQKNLWFWFLDYQMLTVWHQDSPGMRVRVKRSRWCRMWAPTEFSMVGEHHY